LPEIDSDDKKTAKPYSGLAVSVVVTVSFFRKKRHRKKAIKRSQDVSTVSPRPKEPYPAHRRAALGIADKQERLEEGERN
jgi:hypothetical protein